MHFRSVNEPEVLTVALADVTTPLAKGTWANYLMGVMTQFIKRGVEFTEGYDFLIWGNVPLGAGLSSSAALEVVRNGR